MSERTYPVIEAIAHGWRVHVDEVQVDATAATITKK